MHPNVTGYSKYSRLILFKIYPHITRLLNIDNLHPLEGGKEEDDGWADQGWDVSWIFGLKGVKDQIWKKPIFAIDDFGIRRRLHLSLEMVCQRRNSKLSFKRH